LENHQLANVDNLCCQLGEIFHGIMNAKEEQTGKVSKAWVDKIDIVREKLNAYRQKKLPTDITTYQYRIFDPTIEPMTKGRSPKSSLDARKTNGGFSSHQPKKKIKKIKGTGIMEDIQSYPTDGIKYKTIKPKYKVNDLVNVLLQEPVNSLGKKHVDKRFRMGDYRLSKKKYKITAVVCYAGTPSYRYLIEGLPNASYTEQELKQV
jgi:hypothetical protein